MERLSYVRERIGASVKENETHPSQEKRQPLFNHQSLPTTAGQLAGQPRTMLCIFCDKLHDSKKLLMHKTCPMN